MLVRFVDVVMADESSILLLWFDSDWMSDVVPVLCGDVAAFLVVDIVLIADSVACFVIWFKCAVGSLIDRLACNGGGWLGWCFFFLLKSSRKKLAFLVIGYDLFAALTIDLLLPIFSFDVDISSIPDSRRNTTLSTSLVSQFSATMSFLCRSVSSETFPISNSNMIFKIMTFVII